MARSLAVVVVVVVVVVVLVLSAFVLARSLPVLVS